MSGVASSNSQAAGGDESVHLMTRAVSSSRRESERSGWDTSNEASSRVTRLDYSAQLAQQRADNRSIGCAREAAVKRPRRGPTPCPTSPAARETWTMERVLARLEIRIASLEREMSVRRDAIVNAPDIDAEK